MAVRHGYGKIAGTDALVFAYDTGDTRNSYRGEPTTNLYGNWNAYTGGSYEVLDNSTNYIKLLASAGTPWAGQFTALVSAGTYTVSFQHRTDDAGSSNFVIDNDAQDDNIWNATITTTTEWQTYTSTKTHTGTGNHLLYFRRNGGAGNIYIRNVQIELKSHATPFVKGTRSSTQGLLDLTGNRTIELANVSFNSSAQPEFDGSNDLITFGGSANIVNKSYTIEAVFNRYSANRLDGIIGDLQYHWFSFYVTSNNELYFFHRRNSPYIENGAISATGLVGTGYYHAVGVFDTNSGMRVYLNGNLVASNSNTTAFDLSGRGPQYIGQHRGGAPSSPDVMSGQIPMLKIYEGKALTADEVRNNYNFYKGRYGI